MSETEPKSGEHFHFISMRSSDPFRRKILDGYVYGGSKTSKRRKKRGERSAYLLDELSPKGVKWMSEEKACLQLDCLKLGS